MDWWQIVAGAIGGLVVLWLVLIAVLWRLSARDG